MTIPNLDCPRCDSSLGIHEYHKGLCSICKSIFVEEMYEKEGMMGFFDPIEYRSDTIKFHEKHVIPIADGEKYITLRYPVENGYSVADSFYLEAETGYGEYNYIFGDGQVLAFDSATLEQIGSLDNFQGHEGYGGWENVQEDLSQYYNVPYSRDVEVDVIVFSSSCFGESRLIDNFGRKRLSESGSA